MHKVLIADSTAGVPYKWPHHTNELILDRKDAEAGEIMLTCIEPGEQCHRHAHADNEQIYYIISGRGQLRYSEPDADSDTVAELVPGQVVYIPCHTEHQTSCAGEETLVYLGVDVFPRGKPADEPTWAAHADALRRDTATVWKIEK